MSAPNTNLEKQKRRHRGPLIGMALALVFVGALFLGYLFVLVDRAPAPEAGEAPAQATQGG
jgi:NhaP-type Na+/H+ or K+/H+ antiporter